MSSTLVSCFLSKDLGPEVGPDLASREWCKPLARWAVLNFLSTAISHMLQTHQVIFRAFWGTFEMC